MKFATFLKESSYKISIAEDEVIKIIDNNKLNNILYRGMKYSGDYLIINGSAGERKSANTSNYYTLIIDKLLSETDYPLRSKSIICSVDIDRAKDYGSLYVIIPLSDTKVACTNHDDIWNMQFNALGTRDLMVDFNYHYSTLELNDKSYIKFINGLKDVASNSIDNYSYDSDVKYAAKELKNVFKNEQTVEKDVEKLYGSIIDQFTLHNDATDIKANSECWIGGKCLAIKYDVYKTLLKTK